VVDHKFLGESSMAKVRKAPPRKYKVQLHPLRPRLHAASACRCRVVLAAYPRTAGSLDGLYVWEEATGTPESEALLDQVFRQTAHRRRLGMQVADGTIGLMDVPADTGEDRDTECYFCPFYRPQASRDSLGGCPGPDR
jgi:hypothetical protein